MKLILSSLAVLATLASTTVYAEKGNESSTEDRKETAEGYEKAARFTYKGAKTIKDKEKRNAYYESAYNLYLKAADLYDKDDKTEGRNRVEKKMAKIKVLINGEPEITFFTPEGEGGKIK